MAFDLKAIETLAPDQASLAAASKLTKRSHWGRLEKNEARALLWGECQGSGANPYRVVIDAGDQGYKCTCPSRKFPCKHSLALMLISGTTPESFAAGDVPDWVEEWLGRRRKTAAAPAGVAVGAAKSIGDALVPVEAEPEDAAAIQRREAAQLKRASETRAAVIAGLLELDQWIVDQLRLGLAGFIDAASERCRRISSRLIDMKASALASRIDEIPGRLLGLRSEERPEATIRELGKLVLLAEAWRKSPDDPELQRMVMASETREQVLSKSDAIQIVSSWEVLGEQIETRRDGLVSHATWLLNLKNMAPQFALLQDYYPASAGRRANAFSAGERFEARLVFFPARLPLRALMIERIGSARHDGPWPETSIATVVDPLAAHSLHQDHTPWETDTPLLLPAGAILRDGNGAAWWQRHNDASGIALPIMGSPPEPIFGMALAATAAIWDGARLKLLAAESGSFGRLSLS